MPTTKKKQRDDSDMGSEKEEPGTFEKFRDEGMHFVHKDLYKKAVDSFQRALEINPEDKACLVTRAKCYLQLGEAEKALYDAEEALRGDEAPYIKALLMKAEALYQMGHFETSLMFFHRGHQAREQLTEFRLGIQKAQEAINNSIGTPESVKLDTTGDLSFFEKQDSDEKRKKQKKPGKTYKPGAQKSPVYKERERPKSAADKKTIKQLLEELYCDKAYLEKLLNDESLAKGSTVTDNDIKGKVCDGLEYLNSRADFWRQQKPMYARKRDREKSRRGTKTRVRDPTSFIMNSLEEVEERQADGQYQESLATAKKVLKVVNDMSEDELQNKQEILANVHSQMGNAYLEMGKYQLALDHHNKDRDIAIEHDLEDARSRAIDNLGRVYARKGNYDKAVEIWEEKLSLSKSPLESTWLFHEIGRCYLEMEKFNEARDYGEKSIAAAKEADDDGWLLHATVLVAQSESKARDYQAAQESFEAALELARNLDDSAAEAAIRKAIEDTKEKITRGYQDGEYSSDDEDRGKKGGVKGDRPASGGKDDNAVNNIPLKPAVPPIKHSASPTKSLKESVASGQHSPAKTVTPVPSSPERQHTSSPAKKSQKSLVSFKDDKVSQKDSARDSPTKVSVEESIEGTGAQNENEVEVEKEEDKERPKSQSRQSNRSATPKKGDGSDDNRSRKSDNEKSKKGDTDDTVREDNSAQQDESPATKE